MRAPSMAGAVLLGALKKAAAGGGGGTALPAVLLTDTAYLRTTGGTVSKQMFTGMNYVPGELWFAVSAHAATPDFDSNPYITTDIAANNGWLQPDSNAGPIGPSTNDTSSSGGGFHASHFTTNTGSPTESGPGAAEPNTTMPGNGYTGDVAAFGFAIAVGSNAIRTGQRSDRARGSLTSPTQTPGAATDILISYVFGFNLPTATTGFAPPAGMTLIGQNRSPAAAATLVGKGVGVAIAWQKLTSTAATGPKVWTYNGAGTATDFAAGSALLATA